MSVPPSVADSMSPASKLQTVVRNRITLEDPEQVVKAIDIFVAVFRVNTAMQAFANDHEAATVGRNKCSDPLRVYISNIVRLALEYPAMRLYEAGDFSVVTLGERADQNNLRASSWTKGTGNKSWYHLRDRGQKIREDYAKKVVEAKQEHIGHASKNSSGRSHLMQTPLRAHYVLGMVAINPHKERVPGALEAAVRPFLEAAVLERVKVWMETTGTTTEMVRLGFKEVEVLKFGKGLLDETGSSQEAPEKLEGMSVRCLLYDYKKPKPKS